VKAQSSYKYSYPLFCSLCTSDVQVTYSYWDGSGHRRSINVAKGATIGKFLEAVRQQLSTDFSEMRSASSDNLLYIKEDLIIPHSYSFYDLIITRARGKSGPLFHFDVHDDVRVIQVKTTLKQCVHSTAYTYMYKLCVSCM
jgi:protein FAM50